MALSGLAIGLTLGQNVASFLLHELGMRLTWLAYGMNMLMATAMMCSASCLVTMRTQGGGTDLSEQQQAIFAAESGDDPQVFIDKALAAAKEYLTEHKRELWNAPVQGLVMRRMQNLVPALADWEEDKHGRAYMEDLFHAMEEYPEELKSHAALFPQDIREAAQLDRSRVTIQGAEYGGVQHLHQVRLRRPRSGAMLGSSGSRSGSRIELESAGSRLLV